MNDINSTTGLPMSGGSIDVSGTPYGCSSNSLIMEQMIVSIILLTTGAGKLI